MNEEFEGWAVIVMNGEWEEEIQIGRGSDCNFCSTVRKQQQGDLEWIIGNFSVPLNLFVYLSVWLTRERLFLCNLTNHFLCSIYRLIINHGCSFSLKHCVYLSYGALHKCYVLFCVVRINVLCSVVVASCVNVCGFLCLLIERESPCRGEYALVANNGMHPEWVSIHGNVFLNYF